MWPCLAKPYHQQQRKNQQIIRRKILNQGKEPKKSGGKNFEIINKMNKKRQQELK